MSNPQLTEGAVDVLVLTAGLVSAAVVWRKGWLSAHAFDDAPPRQPGLELLDLGLGLLLMVAGALGFGLLLRKLDLIAAEGTDPISGLHPMQQAQVVLLSQVCMQLPVAAYLVLRVARRPGGLRAMGLWPRRAGRELRMGVIALLIALPLVHAAAMLAAQTATLLHHPPPMLLHEGLAWLAHAPPGPRLLLLVAFVLVAPPLEEAIFRGLLQTALLGLLGVHYRWLVIACAAFVFALMHAGVANWVALPALFVLGLVLGWLYERTGSLWPGIVVHALFNAWNCALLLGANMP